LSVALQTRTHADRQTEGRSVFSDQERKLQMAEASDLI